jgi:hypothetical protein
MVKDNNNRLITALLKQIESHRNGEQVDGGMIKSIVDSMGACLETADCEEGRNRGDSRCNMLCWRELQSAWV